MPRALDCNCDLEHYWDLSLKEINLLIESNQRKEKAGLYKSYMEAKLQATFVGCVLAGEPFPEIEELFPDINKNELSSIEAEKQSKAQKEAELRMAIKKEMMIDLANGMNRERHNKLLAAKQA